MRYDNNTTRGGRTRENRDRHRRRRFLHRPSFGFNTVGRGRFSGSPPDRITRDSGGVWNIFFLTQPNLRVVDSFAGAVVGRRLCRVFGSSFVANTVLAGFSWLLLRAFPCTHGCGCVSEGHVYQPCRCGVGGLAATCADALTGTPDSIYVIPTASLSDR